MIRWQTIVVEELHGQWSAWFENQPDADYGGEWPSQAIDRLLEASGHEHYDTGRMHPIDEETRDGHLEFVIRYLGCGELPKPSRN